MTPLHHTKPWLLATVAATVLTLTILSGWTDASQPASGLQVRTIDLAAVLESLDERGDAEMLLQGTRNDILERDEERQAQINAIKADIEEAGDGARSEELLDTLEMKILQRNLWMQFVQREMALERALLLEDLYRKIHTEVKDMSSEQGFDLVLINDAGVDFSYNEKSQLTQEQQLMQQIGSKRIFFASSNEELTSELIVRMNLDYEKERGR
jgi:Skp family chaperone for outer membrane proteins